MIGGGAATGGASDDVVKRWQETLAKHGKETELGGDLIISYSVQLADTEQKAIDEAREWVEERIKMFGPLGFVPGLTPQQLEMLADPRRARSAGLPTIEMGVESGSWFVGPPERIIEQIQEVQDRYPGLEEINIGVTNMGMPTQATLDQLEWFGTDVLPKFANQARVATPAD